MQDQLYGLCHCGCGEATRIADRDIPSFGHVKGEPLRYINGHNRRKSAVEYVEEDRGYSTPCWIWQKADHSRGYGAGYRDGKRLPAHRFIYERHNGLIPAGLVLDHLCRVPRCVNPDHLEPVTHIENCHRGTKTKLTAEQAAEIRALRGKMHYKAVAERYDVGKTTVHDIWSGARWAEARRTIPKPE